MNLSKMKIMFLAIILVSIVKLSFGADVFIPTMDLTTRVNLHAQLETRGFFQLSFEGGYKYQGKLLFQYYDIALEDNTQAALIFDGAQASIRDIFHIIDLTYWTGYYGVIGEGKFYKGHLYHTGYGFDYNGYLPILGTGLVLSNSKPDLFYIQGFIYQQYGSSNINSCDLVCRLYLDPFTIKLFLGGASGSYRIGTQFMYAGEDMEFYLTAGDLTFDLYRKLTFDDLYLLIEQWFKMNNWNLILSVFTRPKVHYNYVYRSYISTNETNDIDFNFNLNYSPEASYFSGGGELNIQTSRVDPIGVYISPYVSIFTSGVTWKIKVDVNLLSQSRDFLTAYLNINASF